MPVLLLQEIIQFIMLMNFLILPVSSISIKQQRCSIIFLAVVKIWRLRMFRHLLLISCLISLVYHKPSVLPISPLRVLPLPTQNSISLKSVIHTERQHVRVLTVFMHLQVPIGILPDMSFLMYIRD